MCLKYQSEVVAHNLTLQQFCTINHVAYNSYEKSVYEYLLEICGVFALRKTAYNNLLPWSMASPD